METSLETRLQLFASLHGGKTSIFILEAPALTIGVANVKVKDKASSNQKHIYCIQSALTACSYHFLEYKFIYLASQQKGNPICNRNIFIAKNDQLANDCFKTNMSNSLCTQKKKKLL